MNRRKAAGQTINWLCAEAFSVSECRKGSVLTTTVRFWITQRLRRSQANFTYGLLALGIGVRFFKHRPPREHSFIERSHQIVYRQSIEGQSFLPADLQPYIEQRLEFLNQYYPSRSLHHQTPLTAYPQEAHSGRQYRPEWEEELLDMQ
jgi:hypothetical protein